MSKHAELLAQIAQLKIQAEEARTKEIEAAVAQVNSLIAAFGLTPKDLAFKATPKKKASRSGVSIKYQDGTGNVWTGRGRTPKWLVEAEAGGEKREAFWVG